MQDDPRVLTAWQREKPTEAQRVGDWRLHVLMEAGYPQGLAEELAIRGDIDLHHAVDLVEHGCTHVTAGDILR